MNPVFGTEELRLRSASTIADAVEIIHFDLGCFNPWPVLLTDLRHF